MDLHELIVRPLLYNSKKAIVYQGTTKDKTVAFGEVLKAILLKDVDILIACEDKKGAVRFDLTKECVKGYEYLWNAKRTARGRGKIVLILEPKAVNFADIFKQVERPSFSPPYYNNNSHSPTLIQNEAELGNIAVTFHQGMDYMEIYANENVMNELLQDAENNCKDAYYYSENCDFKNQTPLYPARKADGVLWRKDIDEILSGGVYIEAYVNNYILDKERAANAVKALEKLESALLCVTPFISKQNGGVFYELLDDSYVLGNFNYKKALEYIENCPKLDIFFALIPRVSRV
jgi:hypothetical protein